MINYHQDDWVDLFPLREFVYNNIYHSSLGHIPFFANYEKYPSFDTLVKGRMNNSTTKDFIKKSS
jgi:hypothetical protein